MPDVPFVGQIMPAGFPFAPKGWALCDGALIAIRQNQALFSLIGTAYGGDGQTTFALPDLRGRAVLGCNFESGPGSIPRGSVNGVEQVYVTLNQLPRHPHQLQASTTAGTLRSAPPTGNLFGVNTTPAASVFAAAGSNEISLAVGTNVATVGGNQPHNNMQPFLVINYVIALTGQFPSRS